MAEPITNVLGVVAIKHCGEYDATKNYEKLNVVTYNGGSYCAKMSTAGNLPTNTNFWDLMAEKGDKGDTGEEGYTPVKGTDYYTDADKAELESTLASDVTSEVTEQLGELTSATPLAASSISGMTDTTRIYVNTTDGHWYWYDGNGWQDGGIYQASESSDVLKRTVDEINLEQESGYGYLKANFINGGLNNGVVNTSQKYRVTSNDVFYFDRDITFKIADGFKIGVHTGTLDANNNFVFSADSGWKTSSYTILKNTYFKIVIQEISVTTGIADINRNVEAIKITTPIFDFFYRPTTVATQTLPAGETTGPSWYYDIHSSQGNKIAIYIEDNNGIMNSFRLYFDGTAVGNYQFNKWYEITLPSNVNRLRVLYQIDQAKKIDGVVVGGDTTLYLRNVYKQISNTEIKDNSITFEKLDSKLQEKIDSTLDTEYIGEKLSIKKNKFKAETVCYSIADIYTPSQEYSARISEGMAIYNGKAFGFILNGPCFVYDIDNNEVIGEFVTDVGTTFGTQAHCNSASFSNTFYDENDQFPLLYLSQCYNVSNARCWVLRMTTNSSQLVQTIEFNNFNGDYTGVYDWILDKEHNRIMTYGIGENQYRHLIKVFNLPQVGNDVMLTEEDVIDSWVVEDYMNGDYINVYQGNTIHNNMLFLPDGRWSENYIYVFNLSSHELMAKISYGSFEMEDLDVYNDKLIVYRQNTNYGNYISFTF